MENWCVKLSALKVKTGTMEYVSIFAGFLLLALSVRGKAGGLLSYDFYDKSCPQLASIVREGVRAVSFANPSTPAALLRLMFHDCQVQGCDASILVDPDGVRTKDSETESSKNFGIQKSSAISLIKSRVEAMCPGQVSCADILVMAAQEAVALSGGPRINVPLGRRDSSSSPNSTLAEASLPRADISLDGMLQLFMQKGMTVEESVAILGAHTLGTTHCYSLQSRLYDLVNFTGNTINPGFVIMLKLGCPLGSPFSKISYVNNDLTPVIFDSQYFVKSIKGSGVLRVDAEMPLDSRTGPFVRKFAGDQEAFFEVFSRAFVKLASSDILTGKEGVIRRTCNALY